jgi:hypothetical protein
MPKTRTQKSTTKPTTKPAAPKSKKERVAKAALRAELAPDDTRAIVHDCIARCADSENFTANTPLRNIGAATECVRRCILEKAGRNLLLSDSDTENLIVAML